MTETKTWITLLKVDQEFTSHNDPNHRKDPSLPRYSHTHSTSELARRFLISTLHYKIFIAKDQGIDMALLETMVVLLSVITVTSACSCMPSHPQEHFCRAQFVIRGKVISGPVQVLPDNSFSSNVLGRFLAERVYTFRITKTYKGTAAIKKTGSLKVFGSRGRSFSTKIYTPSKMNSCRVDLEVGKVYVIAGYIGRKKLSISGCNLRMEWKKITKKQRSGFARKYGRSCECVYQKCYKDCGKEPEAMACNFDISDNPANECRDKYRYCQLSNNGRRCSWTTNAFYRKCINKIP